MHEACNRCREPVPDNDGPVLTRFGLELVCRPCRAVLQENAMVFQNPEAVPVTFGYVADNDWPLRVQSRFAIYGDEARKAWHADNIGKVPFFLTREAAEKALVKLYRNHGPVFLRVNSHRATHKLADELGRKPQYHWTWEDGGKFAEVTQEEARAVLPIKGVTRAKVDRTKLRPCWS